MNIPASSVAKISNCWFLPSARQIPKHARIVHPSNRPANSQPLPVPRLLPKPAPPREVVAGTSPEVKFHSGGRLIPQE